MSRREGTRTLKIGNFRKYGVNKACAQAIHTHACYAIAAGLANLTGLHKSLHEPTHELPQRLETALAEQNMCHF
jgi:hypothetical protein